MKTFAVLALAISFSMFGGEGARQAESLKLKELGVYVVVKDVPGLLNSLDKAIVGILPAEKYTTGTVQALGGMLLSDPELKNIARKPVVIATLQGTGDDKGFAAYIPALNPAAVEASLQDQKVQTAAKDDVVVVAQTPEQLKRAMVGMEDYYKIAGVERDADVRVVVDFDSVMSNRWEKLDATLQEFNAVFENGLLKDPKRFEGIVTREMIDMLRLSTLGISGFLRQSKSFELELKVTAAQIDLSAFYAAKEGTIAAAFLTGAPPAGGKLDGYFDRVTMRSRWDPQAAVDAWKKLQAAIASDEKLKKYADSDLLTSYIDEAEALGGEELMGNVKLPKKKNAKPIEDEQEPTEADGELKTIKDEKKYLGALKKRAAYWSEGGWLSKFIAFGGGKIDGGFEKTDQVHKGIPVFRDFMTLDYTKMSAFRNLQSITQFLAAQEFEDFIAVSNNIAVSTQEILSVVPLLDRVGTAQKPGKQTLKAEEKFGANKQFYADFNLIDPDDEDFDADVKNKPIVIGAWYDKGSGEARIHVPLKPVRAVIPGLMLLLGGLKEQK